MRARVKNAGLHVLMRDMPGEVLATTGPLPSDS